MNVRVNLLDDQWNLLGTVEAEEHRCTKDCNGLAVCESCGAPGTERIIVMIPSTENDLGESSGEHELCYFCLDQVPPEGIELWADPSRCANPQHHIDSEASARPCPECPERFPADYA